MIFFNNQASLRRYLLVALALLLAKSIPVSAEETNQQIPPPPENWYQVEVILFTQQDNQGSETAPQDYQLHFPEPWLQLTDPEHNAAILRLPMVSSLSIANYLASGNSQPSLLEHLFSIDIEQLLEEVGVDNNQIPEASIPYKYQPQAMDTQAQEQPNIVIQENITKPFVPVYEQPFQQLETTVRGLNHSARALDRRNYNVLFHQAWRFQTHSREQSPWIQVKAGPTETGRYQIEGALRFYKARFLHFESNLWRLKFSNNISNRLQLPEIPKKPLSDYQKLMLRALRFSHHLAALQPHSNTRGDWHTDKPLFNIHNLYDLHGLTHLLDNPGDTTADRPEEDTIGNNQYPIEAVWPVNRSQRLQEGEIYYIDHPEMGALVTVKSYTPEPLNSPMEPEVAADLIKDPVKIKPL